MELLEIQTAGMGVTDCGEESWSGDVGWFARCFVRCRGDLEGRDRPVVSASSVPCVPCLPRKQKRSGQGHYRFARLARTAVSSAYTRGVLRGLHMLACFVPWRPTSGSSGEEIEVNSYS